MSKKQSFRSTASFGKRQEYAVISRLLNEGMYVYATLVDDQGIDCVVRKNPTTYYDIQIKARSKDCLPIDAGRFAAMTVVNPRPNYYFIFYSEQVDKSWVMPSEDLVKLANRNKKAITLVSTIYYLLALSRVRFILHLNIRSMRMHFICLSEE